MRINRQNKSILAKDKVMKNIEIKKKLFEQYTRTYNNFDRVMQCLYDIAIFCAGRKDYILGGIIEDCLNDLERKEEIKNDTSS